MLVSCAVLSPLLTVPRRIHGLLESFSGFFLLRSEISGIHRTCNVPISPLALGEWGLYCFEISWLWLNNIALRGVHRLGFLGWYHVWQSS